jgi:phage tail sheath protein FI
MTISAFLEGLYTTGMLAGESADQAYFVDIGPSTMTRDDIENGRLICNIGIAPVKPAEFVIFRVTQFTAEAGGSEE